MSISPSAVSNSFPLPAEGWGSEELRWFAVQTRSRHEKKVFTELRNKRVATFLPLIHEIHRWSDRRKVVEQPLFPGYVFVRIGVSDHERIRVLRTLGVAGFVGRPGSGTAIPDKQIEDVHTLLASKTPFGPFPFLTVGRRVRIRGGCLDGVEGILLAKHSDQSVIVSVDLIQRSLSIRVSGFDLEPV